MESYVTLKHLALELGLDRSNMRKYVLQHGFVPVRVRTSTSRGQKTLALTNDDAQAVRNLRESQGFAKNSRPVSNGDGYFYIVQPDPELAPHRVKLGFTTEVSLRLNTYRTIAPAVRVVKAWPCKSSWELTAITSITREGCRKVGEEVYECDNLTSLIERGDEFFTLMPPGSPSSTT